jgi:DNA polymerase III subunit delta'
MQGIVGNTKSVQYLEDSLASGEVSHAYLFHGLSSVGKTTVAFEFARKYLCENGGVDGCSCQSCTLIASSNHPDLHFLDGVEAGIEDLRQLSTDLGLTSYQSTGKVAIVSHIDSLSVPALNSFLKTLEEPTKNTVIILTADKLENILPTIVSRSRLVAFKPVKEKDVADYLNLECGVKRADATNIALITSGRIGEALSLAENPERAGEIIADAKEYLRVYRSSSIADKISLALKLAADKVYLPGRITSYLIYCRKEVLAKENGDVQSLVSAIDGLTRAYELLSKNINPKLVMETALLGSINK